MPCNLFIVILEIGSYVSERLGRNKNEMNRFDQVKKEL